MCLANAAASLQEMGFPHQFADCARSAQSAAQPPITLSDSSLSVKYLGSRSMMLLLRVAVIPAKLHGSVDPRERQCARLRLDRSALWA